MRPLSVIIVLVAATSATAAMPAAVATANKMRPATKQVTVTNYERLATAAASGNARLIVKFRPGGSSEAAFPLDATLKNADERQSHRQAIRAGQDAILKKVHPGRAAKAKRYDYLPLLALEADSATLSELLSNQDVEAIEEDVPLPPSLTQSVPLIGAGGGGDFGGYSGSGQAVAILDTGVQNDHPMLAGKVVAEACFSTNASGVVSLCPNGQSSQTGAGASYPCASICYHGTHVATIAAGNGGGYQGVAKDAKVIGVQVFSKFTSPSSCGGSAPCVMTYTSDYLSGLNYVYSLKDSHNIAAVNMSLGGGSYAGNCDASSVSTKSAVDNLRAAGIATIIASGNNGFTSAISSPACISSAVAVGATTKSDTVASYSNSNNQVAVLAPGSSIYAGLPVSSYATLSGTSMATPHVAGAFAVLKSRKPSATVSELVAALQTTGAGITDSRNGITKPRIKVASAVSALSVITPSLSVGGGTTQQVGTQVTLSASATGGSGDYEYQFWTLQPGTTTWTSAGPYSSNSDFVWDTAGKPTGTWGLTVWVRESGTTPYKGYDNYATTTFNLTPKPVTSAVTMMTSSGATAVSGSTITLTASASGGTGQYEYQFWWLKPNATTWLPLNSYSATATYNLDTTGLPLGTYSLTVWAKTAGTAPARGWDKYATTTVAIRPIRASLVIDKTSPQYAGTPLTLTGSASGGSGSYHYQFWWLKPGTATWLPLNSYGASDSYTLNTAGLPAGDYGITVWAKQTGTTPASGWDDYATTTMTISSQPAVASASISINKASPQLLGTTLTLTGGASGGTGQYEYQFWWRKPNSSAWVALNSYSSANSFSLDTAGQPAGSYGLTVWVRNKGLEVPGGWSKYATTTFLLTPITSSLTTNKVSPQTVGTTIRLTGAASGGSGNYQYQFWWLKPGSAAWLPLNSYGAASTYDLATAGLPAGIYGLTVWAKQAGTSPATGWDSYATLNFSLAP